jgi:hypothetical protein
MPRRKWIPKRKWILPRDEYDRNAHAGAPAVSLWWYRYRNDGDPTTESERVIDAYIKQVSRGKAVEKNFKDELLQCLYELKEPGRISLRQERYWTLDAYALAHQLPKGGFLKRFREMEKIAAELFPERLPWNRDRRPVTDETEIEIRNYYLQVKLRRHDLLVKLGRHSDPWFKDERHRHEHTMSKLIEKFPNIRPFRLGQIVAKVRNPKRFPRTKRRVNQE